MVQRCIYRIDDDEFWRHGAAAYRRRMRLDGRAQGGGAVWRHGGVDGSETGQGRCSSITLKMDWWQVAAAASYPAGVLVEECAGLVGTPYPAGVLVWTSGLRC